MNSPDPNRSNVSVPSSTLMGLPTEIQRYFQQLETGLREVQSDIKAVKQQLDSVESKLSELESSQG